MGGGKGLGLMRLTHEQDQAIRELNGLEARNGS